MKYSNCSSHRSEVANTNRKWILLLNLLSSIHLVASLTNSHHRSSFTNASSHSTSWPNLYSSNNLMTTSPIANRSNSSIIRSKRNYNIFVDLESDQSVYYHPSPVYSKVELGQSDYWASIKRRWQQSELCPCQCTFDHLNRKLVKCDEQFTNITGIPAQLDPNTEVSLFVWFLPSVSECRLNN